MIAPNSLYNLYTCVTRIPQMQVKYVYANPRWYNGDLKHSTRMHQVCPLSCCPIQHVDPGPAPALRPCGTLHIKPPSQLVQGVGFFYQRVWNHCQQATTGAATRIRKGRSTQPWQFQQAEGEEEEEEKKKKRRRKEEEKKKKRRRKEEEEDDEGASTMLTTSAPTKRQQQQQGGKDGKATRPTVGTTDKSDLEHVGTTDKKEKKRQSHSRHSNRV